MTPETIAVLKEQSKQTSRKPIARVTITWAGNSVDDADVSVSPVPNRASIEQQVVTPIGSQRWWAYCETDDPTESVAKLDENICAMPDIPEDGISTGGWLVGWWGSGANISNSTGHFTSPLPTLEITFPALTINTFRLRGYLNSADDYAEYPVDFTVSAYRIGYLGDYDLIDYSDGSPAVVTVTGNTSIDYKGTFAEPLTSVSKLVFTITRWSRRGAFVKITAAFDDFSRVYVGDDIVSLSVLQETDGTVGTLPVGNVSCNEIDLALQNITDDYFFGNTKSLYGGVVRTNRRIEPEIGFEYVDDTGTTKREYALKGVYWSRDWNIPDQGTTASTSALDRMGLLQGITYNGIGDIAVAEATYWRNTNLYNIALEVLTHLQTYYMHDLEFDIDSSLQEIIIPLAFFEEGSYFDVIKTIAQAGIAYAYMDTPTLEEIAQANRRGNERCADILRIKKVEQFFPHAVMDSAEQITLDDIVYGTKNHPLRHDDVANIINVPYLPYIMDWDTMTPTKPSDNHIIDKGTVTVQSNESIREYGSVEYDYPENNLIQTRGHALLIAEIILKSFSGTPRYAEMNTYGDVTLRVGNLLEVPEYQKNGIDTRGFYSVTRLQTEYDGGLRQTINCRRVGDVLMWDIINEVGNARPIIDERGDRLTIVNETGLILHPDYPN